MELQNEKMGKQIKRVSVIIGNIFIVIILTSIFIYAMEPEIVDKKLSMNPTEAIRDIGIYLVVVGGLLALANKIFNGKIKPQCKEFFGEIKIQFEKMNQIKPVCAQNFDEMKTDLVRYKNEMQTYLCNVSALQISFGKLEARFDVFEKRFDHLEAKIDKIK